MTPELLHSLLGGLLIGGGAAVLIVLDGQIAGISGIFSKVIRGEVGQTGWRIAFLIGLVAPAALLGLPGLQFSLGLPGLALAGLLVGFGTGLGSGCTSGHGVCGIANLSPRSLLATLSFMGVAIVVVFLVRHGGLL